MTAATLPRLAWGPAALLDADGDLLARRDDAAFAELVRRHADMVFGTCRRVLGSAADADDAFQATFLVLLRKADALADRRCVGDWLYGVAFHTALKARAMAAKRRTKESHARLTAPPERDGELLAALDAELAELPEKYRAAVVLCELEGVRRKDAAARLGVAEGTVSSRLATAHRLLEKRLRAKGFAAVAVAALLARAGAARAPHATLPLAAAATPTAAALALEVTKMLFLKKLKLGAALVASCLVILAAGAGALSRTAAEEPAPKAVAARAPLPKGPAIKDEDRLQGLWQAESLVANGQDAPAEAVKVFQLRFKGSAIAFLPDNREHAFALDSTAEPKALDLTPGDGKEKGKKLACAIYELDGDTLRICMDKEGTADKRPTEFKAAAGSGLALLVLKRVKEEKKADEPKKDGAAKPDEPAWKTEFRKAYGLRDGELVRRVAPPYPDVRATYFKTLFPNRAGNIPFDDWFCVFGWKDGWTVDGAGGYSMPVKADEGVELGRLLAMTTGFPLHRIQDPSSLLTSRVTGDFVVKVGADPVKVAEALAKLLQKELDLPVRVSLREETEEVYVVSGKYAAKPLDGLKANQIAVYAEHRGEDTAGAGGGSGSVAELLRAVEAHVGRVIVGDGIAAAPKSVEWRYHVRSSMVKDPARGIDTRREDTDPTKVLDNLAAQTGLTVTVEKRKVPYLEVEKAEKVEKKAPQGRPNAPVPKEPAKLGPFDGRTGAEREKRLKQFGGSDKTEAAVAAGLVWLASKQDKDGGWTFDGSMKTDRAAATGMAVMAFLGAGHTAKADAKNPHAKTVAAGVAALAKMQKPDGSFTTAGTLYAHAIATVALCEAAGMTGDSALVKPAQAALDYIQAGQGTDGSWGYVTKTNGDTCITGWQAQAIRAGKAAGLTVDAKILAKASQFLDTTMDVEKGSFGYRSNVGTPTLTAVGITARVVFDGWTAETTTVARGGEFVTKANNVPFDTYFTFYASAALPLADAKAWTAWNEKMIAVLLKAQVAAGKDNAGGWEKDTSFIGGSCGRIGTTAMAVLTLENYYRYPFPLTAEKK